MKFFTNIETIEELKKEYKKLCFKLHPDKGGNEEEFKAMANEYEELFNAIQKGEKFQQSATAYSDMINKLIKLNIEIDIVGSWIWLSKDTFTVKDKIKALGFKFSKVSKSWYWFEGIENSKKKKRAEGKDKAVAKYGKETIKSQFVLV